MKNKELVQILESACLEVSSGSKEWRSFLETAARFIKYDFANQLLIYMQRKGATACAPFDTWNKLNCQVKRGSKGIGLLSDRGGVTYAFDVNDVYAKTKGGYPYLWELNHEYIQPLEQRLKDIYLVSGNLQEQLVKIVVASLHLEGGNGSMQRFARESALHMLFSRCSLTESIFMKDKFDFSEIKKYNKAEDLKKLGTQITSCVRPVMLDIAKVCQAEHQKMIAKAGNMRYTDFSELTYKTKKREAGAYGRFQDRIQEGRGLPVSSTSGLGRGVQDGTIREVRAEEVGIPKRASGRIVHGTDDDRGIAQAFKENSGTGERATGDAGFADHGAGRDNGEIKGPGLVEIRNQDEQRHANGRRADIERDDLQLTAGGAIAQRAGGESTPAFSSFPTTASKSKIPDNHHVTVDTETRGTKHKFQANMAAIRLLHRLEREGRLATSEEKETLAKYTGWGGLSMAFDSENKAWTKECAELKGILTPEEYRHAAESTLTAFYTPPAIINGIYGVLESMGFRQGRILDPGCGTGNFFGSLPKEMERSELTGVELDSISGGIAKQLYQKAVIGIGAYEKSKFPDGHFDIAIGNVPFGQFSVNDSRYAKQNWQIHDYFFCATLDKVRAGGIIAFITSKWTMDKKNPIVRKYIAQRAELLGAFRLPNVAFKRAGTEVTTDIIFLQKRERALDIEPEWVHLGTDSNGIKLNQYFVEHKDMILGEMCEVSGPHGVVTACVDKEWDGETALGLRIKAASGRIAGRYMEAAAKVSVISDLKNTEPIPANPDIKKYSYGIVDGNVYYREERNMEPVNIPEKQLERLKGLIEVRRLVRHLIDLQKEDFPEQEIQLAQEKLNEAYDAFVTRFGPLTGLQNKRAFCEDADYPLLGSLEILNEDSAVTGKADIFYKRTINGKKKIHNVDTSSEAMLVCLNECGKVDMERIGALLGNKPQEKIVEELEGVIFHNPETGQWETGEEYLSGNVRQKLLRAREFSNEDGRYQINVDYLIKAQPEELTASNIAASLGATWIPWEHIQDFMKEILKTPQNLFRYGIMDVKYYEISGEWKVRGQNANTGNPVAEKTYGTSRVTAYRLLENALNLRDTRIYDLVDEKRVLNHKETQLAMQKQEALREAFENWIFNDMDRRKELCGIYNERFNSERPREFDGNHLIFPEMNSDIQLREHQKRGIARILYGGNTLLAHVVGAGKTFAMIAGAMESKRLGLCQKSLFVVPNHLTGQWADDFVRLYPGANILAATKRDFEPQKRKRFCAKIATGEYDAVIIGHTQFEKIPMSRKRQTETLQKQIEEIVHEVGILKLHDGERFTIKELEKTKKKLEVKLERLNDSSKKDNVVTFEELGVDRLFVDESHFYKNLFLYTKMRNVAGIGQSEAQKSSDLYMKCQYMDEITGGKGITFATGTPISNTMTELYTNMRYLQSDLLREKGLTHFDSWASTFGETVTAMELSPEGSNYRVKTRFAKFHNLPELLNMFKECADIQTADALNLPIPQAEYLNIALEASDYQKSMVLEMSERADRVRQGSVEPQEDNMLKITTDGRKLALEQRLMNPELPEHAQGKAAVCAQNAASIWEETRSQRSTQLIFCDLSTPGKHSQQPEFSNVYDDIRGKLMEYGIPEEEIAFIHTADTEAKKEKLFTEVRSGKVRILIGSTVKMGAGTNVQDKLIALHHLDAPWRPSDIEQQEGRILRQGNQNEKVRIYKYVTKGTFDSYSWQILENKQRFISQIMTSKAPVRSCEDVDEATLNYAEVKALATGNPHIKEKMTLDMEVAKLKLAKAQYLNQKYQLEEEIFNKYPVKIAGLKAYAETYAKDTRRYHKAKNECLEGFSMTIESVTYSDKKEAGLALLQSVVAEKSNQLERKIGCFYGFELYYAGSHSSELSIKGEASHRIELGKDPVGNIVRIQNVLEGLPIETEKYKERLKIVGNQLEDAKIEVEKPFSKESELQRNSRRLEEINLTLELETPTVQQQKAVKQKRRNL